MNDNAFVEYANPDRITPGDAQLSGQRTHLPPLVFTDRVHRVVRPANGPHLDNYENHTVADDQIDFASSDIHIAPDNDQAVGREKPGSDILTKAGEDGARV